MVHGFMGGMGACPQEILKSKPLKWTEIAFRVLYEIHSGHHSLKKRLLKRRQSLPELLKVLDQLKGLASQMSYQSKYRKRPAPL